jgi:uncharacterized protein with PIN domain
MAQHSAHVRFYEELNDFLPPGRKKTRLDVSFGGTASVKDIIESLGVPHTEVDLVVVDGASVGFDHRLKGGESVAVYPVFESIDISPVVRLREQPLRVPAFILDVHLGRLARYLRMLGFDSLYRNDLRDDEIVGIASSEERIVLTRDRGLLKRGSCRRGYWVRSTDPRAQLAEVVERLDLSSSVRPFTICMACNGALDRVDKESVLERLEEKTRRYYDVFHRCGRCGRVYWEGSHVSSMKKLVEAVRWDPRATRLRG